MTIDELEALCDSHEAAGVDGATLVIPRPPRGDRINFIPGVLGEVLAVHRTGHTVARFKLADLRRALRRLREAEAVLAQDQEPDHAA